MRAIRLGVAMAAVLLLAGCLLLPGKFTSAIDLRKDGSFSFAYKGDVHVYALSQFALQDRAAAADNETFEPSACYSEQTGDRRECSAEELAQQKKVWEADAEARRLATLQKRKSSEQMMKSVLGGIDPADPRAAQEFADRLRRQKGWKSVVDKGNGRFEVDYAITGRLDHDFAFPTVEKLPMVTPFVTLIRRSDGSVRLDAPAFTPGSSGGPVSGMAAAAMESGGGKKSSEGMPVLDGTLTLTTDGEVLANNTDNGPIAGPAGRVLSWQVNARTRDAPTALIRINP